MHKKGFFSLPIIGWPFLLLIAVVAVVILIPVLAIILSPELRLLFQLGAAIIIFSWVRNSLGQGMLSYVISGILIFIFVWMLPHITLGLYILYFLLILGILDLFVWTGLLWRG